MSPKTLGALPKSPAKSPYKSPYKSPAGGGRRSSSGAGLRPVLPFDLDDPDGSAVDDEEAPEMGPMPIERSTPFAVQDEGKGVDEVEVSLSHALRHFTDHPCSTCMANDYEDNGIMKTPCTIAANLKITFVTMLNDLGIITTRVKPDEATAGSTASSLKRRAGHNKESQTSKGKESKISVHRISHGTSIHTQSMDTNLLP